jgi:OmpA-OmpF porin, OOP family
MFKYKSVSLSLAAASCFMISSVTAGDVQMYKNAPSAEEMGDVLFSSDKKPEMRTRSISFTKKKTQPHMQEAQPKSIDNSYEQTSFDTPKTIGLPIKFASNSSNIMDESLPFLNEVGKMMTMEKHNSQKLLIEGHTDALGSDDYNFILSYKRAKSVRDYLVENFNVPASRLKVNGKGESEPLDGTSPDDAVNRRVQFYKAN